MEVKEVLDLAKKHLRENNFSELTLINYCFFIEKFLTHCNKSLETITPEDLQYYLSSLLQEKSNATLSLAIASLKFFYQHILKQPFPELHFPKKEKNTSTFLTKGEIKKLIEAADTRKSRLILSFLYASGVKVSELVNLKPQDIDLEKKQGLVKKPLGGSRIFPLSNNLREELKSYLQDYKGAYLFSLHKPLTPRNIQKIVKSTAKRIGIEKKVTPHTLRHSFAKHLLEAGVDEDTVTRILGYSIKKTPSVFSTQDQFIKIKNPHDTLSDSSSAALL